MWNRSLYGIDATSTRRDDCDAALRDGAELAAAALDVARVADERLTAALAAADVGAVHACTPSTRRSPVSWRLAAMACRWEALRTRAIHGPAAS